MQDPWQLLSLAPDASVREVKRRYAQLLKVNRPDDNPEGFALLRRAYEICLAQASGAATFVEISQEPATDAASARNDEFTEPATAASPPSHPLPNHAEWIETRRNPASVVNELLAMASPQYDGDELFVAWFTRCPEITSLAARPAIESALLLHLADNHVSLRVDAFTVLQDGFAWFDVGFEHRLLAQGLHPHAVQRVLATLAPMAIDAQFAQHLAAGTALCKPSDGPSYALGNAMVEAAILRRLHDERQQRPSVRRALGPQAVDEVVALVNAYAARYGIAAVDRLFGADAVNAWRRLHRTAPPNVRQVLLRAIRASAVALIVLGLATPVNLLMPAEERWRTDTLWVLGLSAALAVIAVGTAASWILAVALVNWRVHRARTRDAIEAFAQRPVGALVLLLLVPVILWTATQLAGSLVASCIAIIVVGYFFSARAAVGAAVFILGLAAGIAFAAPDPKPSIECAIATVPGMTWLFDRLVFFRKKRPTRHERGPATASLLAAVGTAALIAGVALA